MKKIAFLLLSLFTVSEISAQQASIPEAPRKTEFAGVTVKLDQAAQKLVQTEIQALLLPENKYLFDKLARMQWYFPIIEKILEDEEIPEDFKYLPVLESGLMPDASSTSNAVGFWQIKDATAQELGLRIDNSVDERKNIYASTRAAALYLKRNNLIYKNWISTLFSYHLGATGVSKSIPSNWTFASEISLDGDTDRYLIKAIAHRVAYEHRLNRLKDSPYTMVEYKNAKGKTLAEVGSEISWDLNELKRYNTWVLGNKIPNDKEYSVAILVPSDQYDDMIAKINRKGGSGVKNEAGFPVLQRVSPEDVADGEPILYIINGKKGIMASAGDDVGQIAKNGKVKPTDFLKFNDMSDKDLVEEGKVYYLQSKNRKAKVKFHNVSENESLWDISQIYGVRLKQLLKFNRMETIKRLQSGRVVYLQSKRPKNQPVEYVQENEAPASEKVVPAKDKRKDKKVEEETTAKNSEKPVVWEEDTKDKKRGNAPKKSATEDEDETYVRLEPQEREKEKKEEVIKIEEPVVTKTKEQKPPIVEIENSDSIIAYEEKPKNNKPTNTPKTTPTKPVEKPVENTTEVVKPKPVVEKPKENTTTATKPVSYGSSYEVQQGETLFAIARKTGIYVRDLAAWNNMTLEDKVKVGQVLTLVNPNVATASKATATKPAQPKEEVKAKAAETAYHLVAKGETLYSISRKYGVSTKQIQDWNGMSDNNVKLGQKLIVKK